MMIIRIWLHFSVLHWKYPFLTNFTQSFEVVKGGDCYIEPGYNTLAVFYVSIKVLFTTSKVGLDI